MKETLSDKRFEQTGNWKYQEEDLKQSIKDLKELGKHRLENKKDYEMYCDDIKEIFGEELTK